MRIRTKRRRSASTTLPPAVASPSQAFKEIRNARSSHRRHHPHADRPCLQGVAGPAAPRGDGRLRGRPAARAQPRGRPGPDRRRLLRRRHAAGPRGLQHRPHRLPAQREAAAGGQRGHRLPLLLLQPRRDPPRRQRDQGRRGRRLPRRRGRVGEPLQRAHRARRRRRPQPEPDRRERPAQRLHRHGHHRRQRRQEVRGQPRRHGQVRAALAGTRRPVPGRRLLRPRDRPGQARGRHRGRPRTTAPAPPRPWRSSPNCRRPSAAAASPPATPARSTTAPPRCC